MTAATVLIGQQFFSLLEKCRAYPAKTTQVVDAFFFGLSENVCEMAVFCADVEGDLMLNILCLMDHTWREMSGVRNIIVLTII